MFRRFDKGDWMGYAGATRFPDGSEPLISYDVHLRPYIDTAVVLICGSETDAKMASVYLEVCDDEGSTIFAAERDIPLTHVDAMVAMFNVPTAADPLWKEHLDILGFKELR